MYKLELGESQMKFLELLLDCFLKQEGLVALHSVVDLHNILQTSKEQRKKELVTLMGESK